MRRRTALFVGAWLAGGAAAVTAASLAVSRVGDQVTGDRPTALSAAEVREELEAVTTTTAPAEATTSTTTTAPTVTTPPTTATPPSTTGTAPPPTAAEEVRTYPLVGGTATLRFTPAGVTVVAATPNPGFSVDTSPERGNGIRVEFDSDEHRSRVAGWWDGGPRDEVREED